MLCSPIESNKIYSQFMIIKGLLSPKCHISIVDVLPVCQASKSAIKHFVMVRRLGMLARACESPSGTHRGKGENRAE